MCFDNKNESTGTALAHNKVLVSNFGGRAEQNHKSWLPSQHPTLSLSTSAWDIRARGSLPTHKAPRWKLSL